VAARSRVRWADITAYLAAIGGPALLTTVLVAIGARQREYVFLYMAVVASIAVFRGLLASLLAATVSFFLVDYFFIPPLGTLTIADSQDLVNLLVFFGTAGLVGFLASRRRQTLVRAEALTQQLQQLNAELVRLNQEQAEAAQAAIRLARTEQQVQLLQQNEQYYRDLLASVSHDLRTPIGSILTDSTNMLLTQTMNASVRFRIEAMAAEARRLNRLVSNMLDMARIEGGALTLTLEPVVLNDAVQAAVERLHKSSPDRPVEWKTGDAAVSVLADWDRLGQIFENLLSNADRFAPPGTPIEIGISLEDAGYVTIRVIDSGPGIPPELRRRLFGRFVKGESDPGGGTGLGLAIVRGLVEAHAGTISLEDRPAGGTSFRFTLPRTQP
jgi:two-component system sensor histidine kinase KdpD